MKRSLENIYFEITGSCNLLCRHCYVFDSDSRRARPDLLTPDNIEQVVRDAVPLGLTSCTFTGGEILVRKDLVDILERAAAHVKALYLLTNLTLLTDAHIAAFKRLPIGLVSTSIDGFSASHDKLRGLDGAYNRTMTALSRLRAENIPVKVSVTVTPENFEEVTTLFERLDQQGVPSSIARVTPIGRGLLAATNGAEFDAQYSLLLARRLGTALTRAQILGLSPPGESVGTHCGVGSSILYVLSDGEVGYCPTMTPVTDARFRLGNVRERSIAAIWQDGAVFGESDMECETSKDCTYGSVCKGGCRANAFTATGNPTACDAEMRKGYDALVKLARKPRAAPSYKIV